MKRKRTLKSFRMTRMVAIVITVIYVLLSISPFLIELLGGILLLLFNTKNFEQYLVNALEVLVIPGLICWYVWPVLIIISWSLCLEDYLYLELNGLKGETYVNKRKYIIISVCSMIVLGIIAFLQFQGSVNFLDKYGSEISQLYDCVVARLAVTACWIACWIHSIKKREILVNMKVINRKKVVKQSVLCIALIALTVAVNIHTHDKAETVQFNRMIEEASQE